MTGGTSDEISSESSVWMPKTCTRTAKGLRLLCYVDLFDLHTGVLWGFETKLISKDHLCVSGRRGMPLYEDDLGSESEYVATKGLQYVLYRIGTVKGVRLDLDARWLGGIVLAKGYILYWNFSDISGEQLVTQFVAQVGRIKNSLLLVGFGSGGWNIILFEKWSRLLIGIRFKFAETWFAVFPQQHVQVLNWVKWLNVDESPSWGPIPEH